MDMKARSIRELAELPDDALVTLGEYQIWNRLSPAVTTSAELETCPHH